MTMIHEPLLSLFGAGFGGAVTTPAEPGYEAARRVWNGAVDARPALIAHCRSTADVVAAVKLTRSAGVPLAVRAGGHSVAGFSVCDGGVVIDLTWLRGSPWRLTGNRQSSSRVRPGRISTQRPARAA
jgi:hypothetical protein